MTHILAIDQGTTSSRAILFDSAMKIAAVAQEEFTQHYPASGWVEHDAGDLWSTTAATCRAAIEKAGLRPGDIAAIGITNQRETTLVWDRKTGKPIHNAIVWQDRRTAPMCQRLKAEGHEATVTDRTGLLLDPYFSATKVAWLLDKVTRKSKLKEKARREGKLIHFGSLMDLRFEKHSEMLEHLRKYKGRVVFRGDPTKDQDNVHAVFTGQSSSSCHMLSAKVLDVISRMPGCSG